MRALPFQPFLHITLLDRSKWFEVDVAWWRSAAKSLRTRSAFEASDLV